MLVNLNNGNGYSHCIYHIEDSFFQQYHYKIVAGNRGRGLQDIYF